MEEEEERCMMTSDSSVLLNLFPDWNQHLWDPAPPWLLSKTFCLIFNVTHLIPYSFTKSPKIGLPLLQ